jgi:regulator of sirC expression with transglutaminase-like and TPR domain
LRAEGTRRERRGDVSPPAPDPIIIDPFHGGAVLSESDCRQLLREHVGETMAFDPALLEPATRHQIVVRMLVNLKRLYVRMRSFPQARFISNLLLAVDPASIDELRDRGLLSYQLEDFGAALRDLEAYLRQVSRHAHLPDERANASNRQGDAGQQPDDTTQIWEHVKTLRKRVASFN